MRFFLYKIKDYNLFLMKTLQYLNLTMNFWKKICKYNYSNVLRDVVKNLDNLLYQNISKYAKKVKRNVKFSRLKLLMKRLNN